MTIFKLFVRGMILSFARLRLAVRLWAVNFLFSLLAVAPFFFLMTSHMAHSFSGGAPCKSWTSSGWAISSTAT